LVIYGAGADGDAGVLATALLQHRSKPRAYIGCMKSGPVLSDK